MIKYKGKVLTAEQESHINTMLKGENHAIQAPPGSGKTFLLLALARKMPGHGLSVSFNRLLSIEASKKFNSAVTCKTGHALAYGAVGFKYKKRLNKLTGKHLSDNREIGDWQMFNSPSNKGYLILNTIRNYCYSADDAISWKHVPKLTILNNENIDLMKEDLIQNATAIFEEMMDLNSDLPITHDVYLKIWALSNPKIKMDYIFFDEYQDSNPVIADVIKRQNCQKIFVGDQFQQIYCQPAGTMISMAKCRGDKKFPKDKSIEDIKIGDNVITFDDSYVFPTGNPVTSVTELNYEGQLIVASTDSGCVSKYIPQHQCMVRINSDMMNKHIVYLMRKGNQFRIGKIPYLYSSQNSQFGLNLRASVEQADAAWILSLQDSSEEAALYEALYQAQFGIPGICFREQDKHRIDLTYFWHFIGDNSARGKNCLQFFGLLLDMPLWTAGYDNMIGNRRVTITAAANLHEGMLMLPLEKGLKKTGDSNRSATKEHWEKIYIYKENYKGKVYSLEVKKNHNYFADGLLTHNSWRGAVNALQDEKLAKLYITRSFRFGEPVADIANRIIKSYYPTDFEYVPFHGNESIKSKVTYSPLNSPNCIICRTNKGVINETIHRLALGDSVHILGGIQPLTYLINSIFQLKAQGYTNHPDLFLFTSFADLKEYADSPMGGDLKAVLKLIEVYGRERLLNILESTTESAEEAQVTITTAHKSKGLEWSSVKLSNDFKFPSEGAVPTQEETNILYVAASRALHKLDVSECQACLPQTFSEAIRINKEKHLIDQAAKQEVNMRFKEVISNEIKDLAEDVPF